MKIFIEAKHWQLFIVFVAICVTPQFFSSSQYSIIISNVFSGLFIVWFLGWLFTIANECNKALPGNLKKSFVPSAIGISYSIVYSVIFNIYFVSSITPSNMLYIFPFHLAAIGAILYSLAFVANRLITVSRGEKITFANYMPQFFMLWFFPIGIWFFQPKVNALLANKKS
jgi:hypothetical protein